MNNFHLPLCNQWRAVSKEFVEFLKSEREDWSLGLSLIRIGHHEYQETMRNIHYAIKDAVEEGLKRKWRAKRNS